MTMGINAYDRAMATRLAERQREQRAASPRKVAQKLLREWLGKHGMGGVIDPGAGALLVEMVEAVVVAERAEQTKE